MIHIIILQEDGFQAQVLYARRLGFEFVSSNEQKQNNISFLTYILLFCSCHS